MLPAFAGRNRPSWLKGVNTAGGSRRVLRVLMPVGMVIDILQKAEFAVCHTNVFNRPDLFFPFPRRNVEQLHLR
eukprot:11171797-Lingulodinium_polyedra.AAC.1